MRKVLVSFGLGSPRFQVSKSSHSPQQVRLRLGRGVADVSYDRRVVAHQHARRRLRVYKLSEYKVSELDKPYSVRVLEEIHTVVCGRGVKRPDLG
jgi:hypothetical protein